MNNLTIGMMVTATFNKVLEVTGKVYDFNTSTVWVENTEDMYTCPMDTIKAYVAPVVEELTAFEKREQELIAAIQAAGYDYTIIGNDGMTHFIIEMFTYSVNVYMYEDRYEMDTVHKGRAKQARDNMEDYGDNNNAKVFKKLNTLMNNLEKWEDK
jgi:hypothetical protein